MVILVAYIKHKETIKLPVTLKDDLWYLMIATLYLFFSSFKGYFGLFDGIILFGLYFVFVTHQYIETKRLQKDRKKHTEEISKNKWIKNVTFMVIGAIGVLLVAEPFVHVIIEISVETGVSAIILAVVISPIASEMPEKISAFRLASRSLKGAEIAVANFIGSKVQASTLLFGSIILLKIYLTEEVFDVSGTFILILFAVLTTLVGVWITYDLKLKLKEGFLVLLLYIISTVVIIVV
ncbi:MAG: hypothetical protein IH840_03595 [Candidatus Heimdallarchaeota archaeon]|nr:hypothetical protein [Candidatus Heimdallarchaeota archaeon]